MYGHILVIEPFACGLHMVAVPGPNYFPPWPPSRQVESHPPVPLSSKPSILLDTAPQKLITVYLRLCPI